MRILIVNPNTTGSMTEAIGRAGRRAASAGTEIIAVNPADGPVSIEGYYDEAFSVPGLLAESSMAYSRGASALGVAIALGEIEEEVSGTFFDASICFRQSRPRRPASS